MTVLFIVIGLFVVFFLAKGMRNKETSDYTKQGYHLFQKGDYNGAIECYTKAIKENPNDWIALNNRANTYSILALKDDETYYRYKCLNQAFDDYNKSLEIRDSNQGNYKAFNGLKQVKKQLERVELEINEFRDEYSVKSDETPLENLLFDNIILQMVDEFKKMNLFNHGSIKELIRWNYMLLSTRVTMIALFQEDKVYGSSVNLREGIKKILFDYYINEICSGLTKGQLNNLNYVITNPNDIGISMINMDESINRFYKENNAKPLLNYLYGGILNELDEMERLNTELIFKVTLDRVSSEIDVKIKQQLDDYISGISCI